MARFSLGFVRPNADAPSGAELTRRARLLAAAAALAALLGTGAAEADDLNTALGQTYLGNPTLDAARAQLRATDEGVPQALSGWRPTVSGQVTAGPQWLHNGTDATKKFPVDGDRNQQFFPRTYSITVTQPLFSGFGTVAGTKAAENRVRAGREQLLDTEQQVLFQAVQAYMAVLTDASILELRKNNEKVLEAQLRATEDRFSAGEVTKTDVAQAQSRLQGATADRVAAEGDLAAAKAVYRQVIGQEPVQLSMPNVPANLPVKEEEALGLAQQQPQVIAAEFLEQATRDDIDTQFSQLLPSISLQGSFNHTDEENNNREHADEGTILGVLTVPLYQAGAPDSRVRQAKQLYQQARKQLDEARRTADQQAVQAWQALITAQAQIVSFQEQVRSTDIALDGVRQEQSVGARTVLDVLDAEQEALTAKVNLVTAQTNLVVARYQLLAAVGRLTAKDLALNVQLYDPTQHYDKVRDQFIGTGPSIE
ncbi:MAG TPA: TolC family outer membrane protein [Candidatus Cybelea sp.]|nr:TolC family outer membrane protein [Candidatus Cybelea sp.]